MRIAVVTAALLAAGGLGAAEQALATMQRYDLDIPRQPLDAALKDLAQQTHLQIAGFSDTLGGPALVGPVKGNQTPEQALDTLLAPQGLGYRIVNGTTIAIVSPHDLAPQTGASSGHPQTQGSEAHSISDDTGRDGAQGGKDARQSFLGRFLLAQAPRPTDQRPAAVDNSGPRSARAENESSQAPLLADTALQEVVVTAERRVETLQKVPASISVFSGDKLQAANAQDLRGYFRQTPNVTFQDEGKSGPRSVDIAIRGVSNIGGRTDAFGVYVDGFNIANGAQEGAVNPALQDIERVEVLRGPQGTFFGRNATGGALNVTTKQPGPKLEGELNAHFGSFRTWGMTGVVNAPVVEDKFFVRAMVNYEQSDGFIKNINPAGGQSGFQFINMKLATRWLINDRLTLDLSGYMTREDSGLNPLVPTGVLNEDTASITGTPVPVSGGLPFYPQNIHQVNQDLPLTQKNDNNIGVAHLRYQGDGYEIHSITGYLDTQRKYFDDLDFTPDPLLTQKIDDSSQSWSQEARIQSSGSGPWVWTVGALYAEDIKSTLHQVRAGTGGFFDLPNEFPIDIVVENTRTNSWAGFGQVTWHALDKLALTAGGRYSHDKVKETAGGISFGSPKLNNRGATDFSDFSPRFSVSYDFTDDVTTYVTASKGYKAGGLQFNAALPSQSFAKENLWNYELGTRSYLFDRRLMVNATVFYMKWKDLQVESSATVTDPDTHVITVIDATTNAASASSKGVELEIAARPIAHLTLESGIGYLNAKFDKFPNALVSGQEVDLSGTDIIRAPRWTISANSQYELPLSELMPAMPADVSGYARAEYSYRSKNKPDVESITHNEFPYTIPSFQIVNFRLGTRTDAWMVEGYLENAFDKKYYTGLAGFGFAGIRVRPNPRTWGMRVSFNMR
ncbi:MAG: TonB-dependent receptor [Proteobacteria bacterium]|nr:TonB-dependent receptor [Pseudomonadota bacterium]